MTHIYGLRAADSDTYFYIGSTKRLPKYRLKQHLTSIRMGKNGNGHLVRKVCLVGPENVVIDVIEECDDDVRFEREYFWIQHYLQNGVSLTNMVLSLSQEDWKRQSSAVQYSLAHNWEWVKQWYDDYKRGIALEAERSEHADLLKRAQRILDEIVAEILDAPPDEQARLIGQF